MNSLCLSLGGGAAEELVVASGSTELASVAQYW
jgi:hypothetical protein